MQHYPLTIQVNKRPESLERLLRVIRHRGFEVVTLNVENTSEVINFDVTVQSERAIDLLKNQLIKLPDVLKLN
ncbi:acetolactate synthase 2 small subunit [Pasteurella atlantica]|uniref:Acetolactate synthase 2 small subunit n=1 Tax=Pasteurella atlantica TaxID=2827233 RepID=A0AAW8CJN2_9PAST|nr:acetolactate synthase 2 small subunit [Pasteurella atlantica]MBR0574370.1 acetolactate synthase 2 small subunit [Pasteurella atlantica]MDP8033715.1 acetolactate synthase 2 small subunit [Pasteurella atlantica]MDP8035650.1 acetolactate synthase 2 small subunit [Pasteurella atlantica]MDP8037669.1 acetolactate synthase 2 small subunit [Pasteurella atlantica]MDP8040247.1 acetolactate synthase 2 small subunit [Pasteurella atlantica]